MFKIAFLSFIAIVALGVCAWAQDPGMPDSAALGNPDCSPVYMHPEDRSFLLLWINNDEDWEYLGFSCGIELQHGQIISYAHPSPFLMSWDQIFDTAAVYPEYPGYQFRVLHAYCGDPCDTPINTDSIWQNIISYRVMLWPDSTIGPGDTIQPILLMDGISACASPIIIVDPMNSDDAGRLPHDFAITRIAPNPFNARTTIHYTLSEPSEVSLNIYNILGQKIEVRDIGYQAAGEHAITWDASGRNSGIYFTRLTAGAHSHVARMVMVK